MQNILQTFYDDTPRWAYSFQNLACITRMMKMEESIRNSTSKYIFIDRSLETDKKVFEAMFLNQNGLNNDPIFNGIIKNHIIEMINFLININVICLF